MQSDCCRGKPWPPSFFVVHNPSVESVVIKMKYGVEDA